MKKLYYFFFILMVQLSFGQYFFEDFAGGSIPPTWTIKRTNTEQTWQISQQQPDGHYEAIVSPQSNTGDVDEWLITPSINLSTSTKPLLEVQSNFYDGDAIAGLYQFEILSSIDNGVSWQKKWDTNNFYYWLDWQTILMNIDLTDLKGQSNVKFAFRVIGYDPNFSGSVWVGKVTVKEDTRIMPTSLVVTTDNNQTPVVLVGESIHLNAAVNPVAASQRVIWSIIDGYDIGSVSDGTVYTYLPGKMTIRATSVDDPDIYDDIEITIVKDSDECNQKFEGVMSYLAGINNSVNQLVANDIDIKANTQFDFTGIKLRVNYDIDTMADYPGFKVNIHADNNGKPGAIIKEFDNLHVNAPFGSGEYQNIQLDLPETYHFPTSSTIKKYWLSVTAYDNGAPIRWAAYDIDDSSLGALGSVDGGTTWTAKQNDNGKFVENIFQILGNCTLLATNEVNQNRLISLYPNPVKDVLNINSKTKISNVEIYDMQGKLIKTVVNQSKILLTELPKGVYLVKIKNENHQVFSEKIIKD